MTTKDVEVKISLPDVTQITVKGSKSSPWRLSVWGEMGLMPRRGGPLSTGSPLFRSAAAGAPACGREGRWQTSTSFAPDPKAKSRKRGCQHHLWGVGAAPDEQSRCRMALLGEGMRCLIE